MATAPKNNAIPTYGEGAETFDSGNRREKSELLGQPHMVYRVEFGRAASGYSNVTLRAVTKENLPFMYVDGSTGIYGQTVKYLHSKGILSIGVTKPDSGEYDVSLIIPDGLSYSEYEGPDGRPTRTYYFA